MRPVIAGLLLVLSLSCPISVYAQQASDPVAQALAQGDFYASKRKYELALDAYKKADKLAHHSSAQCFLKMAIMERKLGDFSSALDDANRAVKAAGSDKSLAIQAHVARATLLTQMSSKPGDKKLREAEDSMRQVLAMEPKLPVASFHLGVVLLKQERDADGIAQLNQYLTLNDSDTRRVAAAKRFIESPVRAREPFAPDFSFETMGRETVSNASLRGKVVLLDFWGTWCPPCRESVPILRNLQKKYAGKLFQIVGVSSDDDEDVWRTFIQAQRMNWSEYIDLNGEILHAFDVDSFPTYVVLDKDGVIRYRESGLGSTTQIELEEAIDRALKRNPNPAMVAAGTGRTPADTAKPIAAENGRESNATAVHATATYDSAMKPMAAPNEPDESSKDDAEVTGVEVGTIRKNTYRNEALGLTYDFPKGWIAASVRTLHGVNEKNNAAMKSEIAQHSSDTQAHSTVALPLIVFYASQSGEGDGKQLSFPCIVITAVPTSAKSIDSHLFRQWTNALADGTGTKVLTDSTELDVNDHAFLRSDFVQSMAGAKVYRSHAETVAKGHRLIVEIYSFSEEELRQLGTTLKTFELPNEE